MEMIKKAHEQVVILTSAHRDLLANVREVSDDDANDHDRSFVEGLALSCSFSRSFSFSGSVSCSVVKCQMRSMLQCVAVCCSVLQCVAVRSTHCNMMMRMITIALLLKVFLSPVAVCCSVLQCVAVCCSALHTLQHTAT